MHIEPTSRCTLACPACPRTWFSEKFNRPFPKQDLNLDDLIKFLDCDSGRSISNFTLNGNHGDPIYYPDLIELIETFRSKTFKISTAGSHQSVKFWERLSCVLRPEDTVYFSIDGLKHNNHLYRRNSDWDSIMQAIDIVKSQSPARVVWKTLVFSYNQNEINQIQELAESKGLIFTYDYTHRFGDDSLKPIEAKIDVSRLYKNNQTEVKIEPQCSTEEFIAADGYYWPCCLITSMFTLHKTKLWLQREQWAIRGHTLDQLRVILEQWKQDIIFDPANAHPVCKMNCKPGQKFGWINV